MIRPLFMNRSDRSVTSKIDLELKRLRGEQSDPYPQLNPLRERVYGMKAVERPQGAMEGVEGMEDEDEDEAEESSEESAESDSAESEPADSEYHDHRKDTQTLPSPDKLQRRAKRIKAAAAAKRHQKRLRKLRLQTRSRVKRLLKIGTDMTEEPSRSWLGDRVYEELQVVEGLFRQLREEQRLLVEYSRSVAGEVRLVKQLLE